MHKGTHSHVFTPRFLGPYSRYAFLLCSLVLSIPALIYVGSQRTSVNRPFVPPDIKLIAIIPFTISGDSGVELDSFAVEEALQNFLGMAHISTLLEGRDVTLTEVGKAKQSARSLGAQIVITGNIHKERDRLYLQLEITDTKGTLLFSRSSRYQRIGVSGLVDGTVIKVAEVLGIRAQITPHFYRPIHAAAYERYLNAVFVARYAKSPDELRDALALYKDSLTLDPGWACSYAGIAEASLHLFSMTRETAWLTSSSGAIAQASTAQNTCFSPDYRVARLLREAGQNILSLNVLNRLSERLLYSDQLKRDIAHVYLTLGMYSEAVKESLKATVINPKQWRNFEVLGECYLAQGRYHEAIATFGDVLALKPTNPVAYHNLGAAYLYNGAFAEAIVPFRRAITLKPTAATYSNLGTAHFYLGNTRASIEEYATALSLDSKSEEYAGNLATAYRLLGRSDKAREYFGRALAFARNDLAHSRNAPRCQAHIALYEAQLGRFRTSYRLIAKARNLNPRNADLLYAQIVIETLAKDHKKALQSASRFLALRFPPSLIQANPNLTRLHNDPNFIKLANKSRSSE